MFANSETVCTSLRRRNMQETFASRPASFLIGALFLLQFLAGCDYARMKDDEAIQTYHASMPTMPAAAVPFADSHQRSMGADPKGLKNPLSYTAETVQLGMEKYGYYCVHCHGPTGKGNGTVGQSFAPLPTDLQGPHVQRQTDGEIFYRTSVGYKRHPPMAYTVAERDRWAIVIYIRSLVTPPTGKGS